ncbi:MAG TPA: ADOP family duplicated permease [Bryobacteraceae bacterium]|jgi:predicted permease
MAPLHSLLSSLTALFRRSELDDRVDEELRFHLHMQTQENLRRGMAPPDARSAARRTIGNATQVREEVHRMNTLSFLEETAHNLRFSLRAFRKNPGYALTAVLVLALGLGAATAMFGALDRILFRPLPYADADRLVNVGMIFPVLGAPGQSQAILYSLVYRQRWKPAPAPFAAVTTMQNTNLTCDVTERQPERLRCATVESNFLQTLGVRPALGRDFTPEDAVRGAPPVAIVSYDVWTRRFGAGPGAIGRTIELNGRPIPVIGVLPAGFEMPRGEADILQLEPLDPKDSPSAFLTAFGRLKPGITPDQAQAAIAPLIEANASEVRDGVRVGKGLIKSATPKDAQPWVVPLREYRMGDASRLAWLLLGAVAGLLLIACVNVTNLILARMATRNREFAVRSALGAGRARLARLAIAESLLLAVAGGGLGLFFAAALLRVFVQLAPAGIPEIRQASLDLRVFAIAAVLALAAGAAVGIWPALSVLRSPALQSGPRATAAVRPRLRFTLVTVQIALTVAMLGGSALLLRTLWNLVAVPLGYRSERIVTMNVTLNVARYPIASRGPFFERLLDRIREIPGTEAAAMTNASPPTGIALAGMIFPADGRPRDSQAPGPLIRVREVTPGYFQIFGIPILRGHAFADVDRGAQPETILSEAAARILFPGQDPIGHTVQLPPTNEWAKVVGVAREIRNTGPTRQPEPELYAVWRRNESALFSFSSTAYFAIRTQTRTAGAIALLKQAAADLDPQIPVTVQPLDEEVARLTERARFVAWLLSAFAGLALILAAAGLYGVASYLVAQRTRDIGVRMALGAAPADISRQVVAEAGRWIAAGAALGCALAWAGTRALKAQLYGIGSHDPLSWIAALAVLCAALLLAVLRPAARAARVDPMEALRAD